MAARALPMLTPDPVIEALKQDVDRTLLRANLRLSPYERLLQLQKALDDLAALRETFASAGRPKDLVALSELEALLEERSRAERD